MSCPPKEIKGSAMQWCFGRLSGSVLATILLASPGICQKSESLTLGQVQLEGTKRLTTDDVVRGLGLQIGGAITRDDARRACERLQRLKIFDSLQCQQRIEGQRLSVTVRVEDKCCGTPVVFDNFVWTSNEELLARVKRELPLFMPELPIRSGLVDDICRVLQQVDSLLEFKRFFFLEGCGKLLSFWGSGEGGSTGHLLSGR